jgi:hypothetical protein
MTKRDREEIIAQLSIMTHIAESYYEKMSDEELLEEMRKYYE